MGRLRLRGEQQGYVELVPRSTGGQVEIVLPDHSGTLATEQFVRDIADEVVGNSSAFTITGSVVARDSRVPAGMHAMSAGPVTIPDGVSVTIEDAAAWTVL